jgi:hypothetical protein
VKKKFLLSAVLSTSSGAMLPIPIRIFDTEADARREADKYKGDVGEFLNSGHLCVVDGKGNAQQIMSLNEFLVNYLRATGLRPLISELAYDDGAPEILLPKPSGLIIPG